MICMREEEILTRNGWSMASLSQAVSIAKLIPATYRNLPETTQI